MKSTAQSTAKCTAARGQNTYNKYVTKYKRTKNLVKKCKDISDQCELDIILVIRDRNSDRCREFHTSHDLTIPDLVDALKRNESLPLLKYERIFAGAADSCSMYADEKPTGPQSKLQTPESKSEDDTNSQTKMAAANSHVMTSADASPKLLNYDQPSSLSLKPSLIGVKRPRKSSPDEPKQLSQFVGERRPVAVANDMPNKSSESNLYATSIFRSDS